MEYQHAKWKCGHFIPQYINPLRSTKCPIFCKRHFKWIFLYDDDSISIRISLKFDLNSPIDSKSALVEIMARGLISAKPYLKQCLQIFMTPYGVTSCNELQVDWLLYFFTGAWMLNYSLKPIFKLKSMSTMTGIFLFYFPVLFVDLSVLK